MPNPSSSTVPRNRRVEAHVPVSPSGPHFSEYLYFTVTEDCTVLLACKVTSGSTRLRRPSDFLSETAVFVPQVANVKKETSFHWFKEDDEIVPEGPPNVLSGACALPLPLVTTGAIHVYTPYCVINRNFPTRLFFPSSPGRIRASTRPCSVTTGAKTPPRLTSPAKVPARRTRVHFVFTTNNSVSVF